MTGWLRTLLIGMLVLVLGMALAACGEDVELGDPGDTGDPATEPEPDEEPEGAMELTGTFDGDAQLEGGCAWLDGDDGTRYEVLWPDGYEVRFEPLELVGPDGEVVAERGETLTVTGDVARDVASFCMVGTMFQAETVEA